MASSENLLAMEPWVFRTTFADSWLSDAFSRDADTISKALQKSFSDDASCDLLTSSVHTPTPTPTSTISGGSEGDNNAIVSKRRNPLNSTVGGKVTKRKSRASKRGATTFITADPSNFRQMVQQVTGVRLNGNGQLEVAPLLKPEPQRLVNRLVQSHGGIAAGVGCLPTLDTSAFLLNPSPHPHPQAVGPASTFFSQPADVGGPTPSLLAADGGSASAFDFDSYCSFHTLESWNA